MKMVLLNPLFQNYASIQPPLGLAYLSAAARHKGIEVNIVDANAEKMSLKEVIKSISFYKPDILAVTSSTPVFDESIRILKEFKKTSSIPVVMGGPHACVLPEEVLLTGVVDIAVIGEGEITLIDLIDYLSGNKALKDIPGIGFLDDGQAFFTPPRAFIKDMNNLPFPDWDGFPLQKYSSPARKKYFSLPIMTSRGCPNQCYFCYKGVFGGQYRFRSPENVVNEVRYLKDKYSIQEYCIIDDNFNLLQKRAEEICRLTIKEKIGLPWSLPNGIRVKPLSKKLLQLLKKSGCYRVFFGAETGDQKILDNIDKGITLEDVRNAVALTKEAGLEAGVFFMIGNIGEDETTINKTIQFAIELDPDFTQFTVATPYPGTAFYERVKKEGRFLFKKWEELGSYGKAMFEHGALTADLLDRKFQEAYSRYYLRPSYFFKKIKKIKTQKDIRNLLQGINILRRMRRGDN